MGLALGTHILLKVNVIVVKNHDFSKGSTWPKCSYWPNQMFNLTQGMKHEKHMVLFIGYFDVITSMLIYGAKCI
jgi:hypothetical protein